MSRPTAASVCKHWQAVQSGLMTKEQAEQHEAELCAWINNLCEGWKESQLSPFEIIAEFQQLSGA